MLKFLRSLKPTRSTSQALREREGAKLPALPGSAHSTGLVIASAGTPPATTDREKGGSPQFPGLSFEDRHIEFDDRAETNDAAIRASLIYFKHRWPNRFAVLTGSLAWRVRVWEMAQELGVPMQGPHPLSCNMPVHIDCQNPANAPKPSALASSGRQRLLGS